MSVLKSAYGSILVTVIVLALALVGGNAVGQVQAAPSRAPVAAPQVEPEQQTVGAVGEVSGTALPGDTVRVTQGETLIGETVAKKDGTWRVPIPNTASATAPYHVQILPGAQRGAGTPDEQVSIVVIVVVGSSKVEVRVQVTTPNGQVDIEVQTPINPPCEAQEAAAQVQPTAQPTVAAAAAPVYHQVRAGETLAIIGARYGVTPQAIMQANRLRNANLIFVGQRLLIPGRQQ